MITLTDRPAALCDSARGGERRARIADAVRGRTIAVLMGGDSGEREVSLRSGAGVAAALRSVTEAHVLEVDLSYTELATRAIAADWDLAYNALHGGKGEDGAVQGWLECAGVPYTGPGVLGCASAMDKPTATRLLDGASVPTPAFIEFDEMSDVDQCIDQAVLEMGLPLVTKPSKEGSSLGVRFCHSRACVAEGVAGLLREYRGGMICELIPEPEITVSIVHGHPLPVLELVAQNEFYDYEAKYTKGMTQFVIPARLDPTVYARALTHAKRSAEVLSCQSLARVDMRVDSSGQPKVMDVNASPGMTETSDLPAQAEHMGLGYPELTLEILGSALVRGGLISAEEWQ